jgi:hypothetical protein
MKSILNMSITQISLRYVLYKFICESLDGKRNDIKSWPLFRLYKVWNSSQLGLAYFPFVKFCNIPMATNESNDQYTQYHNSTLFGSTLKCPTSYLIFPNPTSRNGNLWELDIILCWNKNIHQSWLIIAFFPCPWKDLIKKKYCNILAQNIDSLEISWLLML